MFSPAGFEEFFREISQADVAGRLDEAEMQRLTEKYDARWWIADRNDRPSLLC